MRTIVIKALEASTGVHPRSGWVNIRMVPQSDNPVWTLFRISNYVAPATPTPLQVSGGVMRLAGQTQEVTQLNIAGNFGSPNNIEVRINPGQKELYLHFAATDATRYVYQQLITDQATEAYRNNMLLTDFSFDFGPKFVMPSGMFRRFREFNSPIPGVRVGPLASLIHTFNTALVFNRSLAEWDTTGITSFESMFSEARSFNQSLNHFNTSSVTAMQQMFAGAINYNQPMNNWDVSKVELFVGFLSNTTRFDQDLSAWNFHVNAQFNNFLSNSGISPANYDKLLIKLSQRDWSARTREKLFQANNVRYSSEAAHQAKATLVAGGWTILDGGRV